jgi:hypothetical protein
MECGRRGEEDGGWGEGGRGSTGKSLLTEYFVLKCSYRLNILYWKCSFLAAYFVLENPY